MGRPRAITKRVVASLAVCLLLGAIVQCSAEELVGAGAPESASTAAATATAEQRGAAAAAAAAAAASSQHSGGEGVQQPQQRGGKPQLPLPQARPPQQDVQQQQQQQQQQHVQEDQQPVRQAMELGADADADADAGPPAAESTLGRRPLAAYQFFPFLTPPAATPAPAAPAPAAGNAAKQQQQQQQQQSQPQPRIPPAVLPASSGKSPLERARDVVSRMTLAEKLSQLNSRQREVPRLGLPAFDFLSECLHGYWELNPYGIAPTIFPQPLAMAASFDRDLVREVFAAISDEMRARSNEGVRKAGGVSGGGEASALTCWTPHINILRDPRWGRGSETWGEDPHLTAVMAAHVVRGLQGDAAATSSPGGGGGGGLVKVAATCKHFLGYSFEMADGESRYSFDAKVAPQDLADTYLPAFDACVRAAGAQGVMCAYNAVDGTPMCANDRELKGRLRAKYGFGGYVVSDCNAVAALVWGHRSSGDNAAAVAAAIKGGVDILCDNLDAQKPAADAISQGLLSEADVDAAVANTLAVRFRTGQFEPSTPWDGLGAAAINSAAHRELARRVAQKGIVLLKNDAPLKGASGGAGGGAGAPLLPLDRTKLKKVCVVGPLADSPEHLLGNYYGLWNRSLTASPLAALRAELAGSGVQVATDDAMRLMAANYYDWPLESALGACAGADAALVFVGNSMIANPTPAASNPSGNSAGGGGPGAAAWRPVSEGEGLDRESLALPGRQMDLVKALAARNPATPVALVAITGGPVDLEWARRARGVPSIIMAGYPGQEGGRAIADVLLGRASPSGRLPNTWYHSNYTAAAPFGDMAMRPDAARRYPGRTYRFVADQSGFVQYPFGYGLSYTTFSYSGLKVDAVRATGGRCAGYADAAFCVSVTVTNAGGREAEEVVLLYVSNPARAGSDGVPLKALRGFARTPPLKPGAAATVQLPLGTLDFMVPNAKGAASVRLGRWRVAVGALEADVAVSREAVNLKRLAVRWPARSPVAAAAAAAGA